MNFEEKCRKIGVTTVEVSTTVPTDVYNALLNAADEHGKQVDELLRDFINDCLCREVDF